MRPDEGARKQIEVYRRMTGRQRLAIALEMWDTALAVAKASEKALNPHLSEGEIEKRARKRMADGTTGAYSLVD
jgi:hypothetical protein